MNPVIFNALAILFGLSGSLIMFLNGHVTKPHPWGIMAPSDWKEISAKIDKDNMRIMKMQRLGMPFLFISFSLQGVALCIP